MDKTSAFAGFTPDMVIDMLLRAFHGNEEPSLADVEAKVSEFLQGPFAALKPQHGAIVDEILRRVRVRIGIASTLDEKGTDHQPWLDKADRAAWRYWPRLLDYLRRVDKLPPAVLQELDRSTDQALERLESPDRPPAWDRRGLVVGHVQSGKTTHYTSLTAKALDSGYQIVIILAGIHNSLRSQTHERIDKHLIGKDSAALIEALRRGSDQVTVKLIGVGEDDHLMGRESPAFNIVTFTNSAEDGDFRTQTAKQIGFQVSLGSRLVLVVKKNATILKNLTQWLRAQNSSGAGGSAPGRISAPALVIDDEADHASVNTSDDPENDPSRINELIRKLLISFERVGFVGYTATPFANIFIGVNTNSSECGPDLFPRSFIVNLKTPSDYIGPAMVFGHPGDESAGIPEEPALPMFVRVADSAPWIPDKHDKQHLPGLIPDTLKEAIRLFLTVCAARACRGDVNVHNSMLVHATRFINVQGRVAEQIENELVGLRNILNMGSGSKVATIQRELEGIWRKRVLEPHDQFRVRLGERCSSLPTWEEVWSRIPAAALRIEVRKINGGSGDALAYSRNPLGIYVIAVGGDKLSRGLTLEGLSVSYFLRASKMFDTLMQMGRWFGYRPRYADLCRVYTTTGLYSAFQEIALAMDDLRADFDRMADAHMEPVDFGLRVRTPSDGLLITAANKIRLGEDVEVRFAREVVQSLKMPRTEGRADEIRQATKDWISSLGAPLREIRNESSPHYLWHGVPVAKVLDFLSTYEAYSSSCFNDRCDRLRQYIRQQVAKRELGLWTIAVISKNGDGPHVEIGPLKIVKVTRSSSEDRKSTRYASRGMTGTADEAVDLNEEEFARAIAASSLDKAGNVRSVPERERSRDKRPPQRGLMLLYLIHDAESEDPVEFIPAVAVSFPWSPTAKALSYCVGEVWRREHGLLEEASDVQSA